MSLKMTGQIDGVFVSIPVSLQYETGGGYVDGVWVDGASFTVPYVATVQPMNPRQIDNLVRAGERILDGRNVYINSGDLSQLSLGEDLLFSDQRWKIIRRDVREWRDYAHIMVDRYDQQ